MDEANQRTITLETRLLERVHEALSGKQLLNLAGASQDFAPFLALFQVIDLREGDPSQMRDGSLYLNDLPAMIRMHAANRTSHVLITGLNENWGAFSTTVPHRTVNWGVWHDQLLDRGCTVEMVRAYLDDPAVKAVVTPQHTALWHPTILSLPLGISHRFLNALSPLPRAGKTQDLLLNNSGWGHREKINERVIANFGGTITNTFGLSEAAFIEAVLQSRFVLCPSGLGWDTYRLWETLTLGSIPIVEYAAGWHTVLADLPVLFVTNFDEVTPALLARAYPEILSRYERFDFGKLTTEWWASRITGLLDPPPSTS